MVKALPVIVEAAKAVVEVVKAIGSLFGGRDLSREFAALEAQQKQLSETNKQLAATVGALLEDAKKMKAQADSLRAIINFPLVERTKKLKFVNGLNIEVKRSNLTLLLGPKGRGKSTFLWLKGVGPKPAPSLGDGTVELTTRGDFVDTIGVEWTLENMVKLVVLLLRRGIPREVIIFTRDRVMEAIAALAFVGIHAPLIAVLKSESVYEAAATSGTDVDVVKLYDMIAYELIRKMGLPLVPVTHKDVDVLRRSFVACAELETMLGGVGSRVQWGENDPNPFKEVLLRFLFLYETKYQKDDRMFLSGATLADEI